ncbi:MAG: DUF167 domain-containing protein [Rickettsiales bacterium]|jgi:uncharacterized protein (TIGR00251 family)|nr:DUF167 domain-containing protein [Rickettsiales bacterium]
MSKTEEFIKCHLIPNARREGVAGEYNGRMKIMVTARAVGGAANRALTEFIAKKYGVPKSTVKIVAGLKSRDKTVKIEK